MSSLVVPFDLRGAAGEVRVDLRPNDEPVALGCDLLDRSLPPGAARGFPVCRAEVALDADGYAAVLGWVQLVRATDQGDAFALDPLALLAGVDTPYAFFGVKPLLFDAPFRATREDLTWRAESYLCAGPDGVMSRLVKPVAGFSWGFDVRAGEVVLVGPGRLAADAWDRHLGLLRAAHPTWVFDPA